jgi:hypothetical protein
MKKVVVLALLAIVLVIAFLYSRKPQTQSMLSDETKQTEIPSANKNNWKQYNIKTLDLSFSAPLDLKFEECPSDDSVVSFTLQRGQFPNNDYYQLYAFWQNSDENTYDVNGLKEQLLDGSKETQIGGYEAIQGQYKGERGRLVTFILTDRGILNLATSQPTSENEKLTNSILDTFSFEKSKYNE